MGLQLELREEKAFGFNLQDENIRIAQGARIAH